MAQKLRKRTEWETLVVKAIFALIGAVLGTIFFVSWFYYNDEVFRVMASLGFVTGGIVGWFWASKELWQD